MAVSEQTPYIEYTANGIANSFALEFDCENQDHLIVLVDNAAPSVGAWSLSGGSVVFGTAPGNGKKITIQRNTPASRSTNYKSTDNSFRPDPINKDFDRAWWKIQELGIADWLLGLKIQKFRDDVNLTALENTLKQSRDIRDATSLLADEVQANTTQSATLLTNTTAKANAAATSATNANTAKTQAQQAVTDANGIKTDMYTALYSFQNGATKAYPTLAVANADIANIALDTKVTVLSATDGGDYYKATAGATSLTKSPYDQLTQAKADATTKANAAEENAKNYTDTKTNIKISYVNGNKIGGKTKRLENKGVASDYKISTSSQFSSIILEVLEGEVLCILNSLQNYNPVAGWGVAFFAENPETNITQARLTDNRITRIDGATNLSYLVVTTPVGAKYLLLNYRFNSTTIDWAVHSERFLNNYSAGTEIITQLQGDQIGYISEKMGLQILNGTGQSGELFTNENILLKTYLNQLGALTNTTEDWRVLRLIVSDGDIIYLKLGSTSLSFPFKAAYSKVVASSYPNTDYVADATIVATDQDGVYYCVVPSGLGIKALYINYKIDSLSYSLNLTSVLSAQRGYYLSNVSGKPSLGIGYLGAIPIVDITARTMVGHIDSKALKSRFYNKNFFAFGDSITEGTQGGYLKYISPILVCNISNYGSSGSSAQRMVDIVTGGYGLPRRDGAPLNTTQLAAKDYASVKGVSIMIGTNDALGSGFGSLSDVPSTFLSDYANPLDYWALFPSNYTANIALCIEFMRSKNPELEIHLVIPPYRRRNESDTPELITKLIPYLEAIAKYYSVHLIYGIYESGIGFKGMHPTKGYYTYDGTHFNVLGNKVWGNYIANKILSYS